jgi:hypothetical protein
MFTDNRTWGSGISIYDGSPLIEHNFFVGNGSAAVSVQSGGAPLIEHNLFIGNGPRAVEAWSGSPLVTQNTFILNGDNAIYLVRATAVIKNNIIVWNQGFGIYSTPGLGMFRTVLDNSFVSYNDVFGNSAGDYYGILPGAGSISINPAFCDTSTDDFQLSSTSPCVGTGEGGANMGALGIGCGLPEVVNINIGGYEDSLHITSQTPPFAWKYFDSQGSPLTKSELEVGTDTNWTVAEMWQPPTINSTDTSITYAGLP